MLNFVILELIYSSDFHEIFHVDACVEFCFPKINLTINMQLLYFITTVKLIQPGTISVRGTVLYRASSFFKFLPARASEQGNVFGWVSGYISESAVALSIGECGSTLYVGLSGIVRNLIQKSTV